MAETPELSFLSSTLPYFENQNGLESVNAEDSIPTIDFSLLTMGSPDQRSKHNELESVNAEDSIPTIDFSLLTMGSPDQRSKVIHDLGKFCQEWGFFLVINHGVPEGLAKGVFDAADEFFNLKDEEKKEFETKLPLAPISCGNSFHNADKKNIFLWRDYLKVISHPDFHFPKKPLGFSELAFEYCKRSREVAMELMKGVMESLGIEETEMKKSLNLESGLQMFAVNLYPPCPNPEAAMGLPPHTDHGLLTLLMQNGVEGLQIQHNGKWVIINEIPNSFIVNVGDQLEIFSNGKYKSVMHRAIVNDKIKRLSIAMPHGPSLDTIVAPSFNLLERTSQQSTYIPMNYKEYIEQMIIQAMKGKPILEQVRIQRE
ncbi:hypothetical protein LguiB_006275 [Lonicera macranthoides]